MAKKQSNIISGLTNAKTRTLVLLFGGIIVIGVVIAVMRSKSTAGNALSKQGSQSIGVPSDINAIPGSVVSEQYRDLQIADNERKAQLALKQKTSAIPTIIGAIAENPNASKGNQVAPDSLDAALKTPGLNQNKMQFGQAEEGGFNTGAYMGKSARERELEAQEAKFKEQKDRMEKMRLDKERQERERQQQVRFDQDQKAYEAAVQRIAGQMKAYASGAYQEWNKFTPQAYVQGEKANQPYRSAAELAAEAASKEVKTVVTNKDGSTTTTTTKVSKADQTGKFSPIKKPKIFIKAGTVLFGVLDTSINTDEPGPVLATIVSGKYQGSKVLGTLSHQAQQESVIVSFTQLSVPKRLQSIGIQAVAIDPDTARTALATDVNHHYLLRYGTLFASAFVSGYGKAIQQSGATTTTSPLTGATTTTNPPLDNRQIFLTALGNVGTQWAQATRQMFDTPYTVTVDQGTGIGLLFLSDVDVSDES